MKSKNEKYKQRNSTPFHNPVNTPTTNKPKDTLIPGKEPIDAFIDNLIEGEESIIQDVTKALPTSLLLQREFETRDLPTIWCVFDGDSKQLPNFIQNFKHCVHNKISFSDSVRMDLFILFYFIYSLFNVDNTVKITVYKLFSYRKLLIYVNHLSKKPI